MLCFLSLILFQWQHIYDNELKLINFPDIKPEIFTITIWGLDLSLRWYAVSYIIGFIFAIYIMKFSIRKKHLWNNQNPPIDENQADSLLTYLILGVIIGGRLGYVIFYNSDYYFSNFEKIIKVWDGGMSFHGGFQELY